MITETVNFNGKDYLVYNPGVILRDGRKVIDQLKDGITPMPKSLNIYIKSTYNLTPEEYYIIVVLRGDNNSKERYCQYPGCNNELEFVKIIDGYRVGCCRSHAHYLQCMRNIEEGTNPIGGELGRSNRKKWIDEGKHYGSSKENSERMRKINLEMVANGTNPFLSKFGLQKSRIENGTHNFLSQESKDNTSNRMKELAKEGKHAFQSEELIQKNKDRIKSLVEKNEFHLQKLENKLKANKASFLSKGKLNDICHIYVVRTELGFLKIGTTISMNSRYHMSESKSISYDPYVETYISYAKERVVVAELEYELKLKFSKFAIKGTEYFSLDMKDEIITELNRLLSSTTIETTDEKSGKE